MTKRETVIGIILAIVIAIFIQQTCDSCNGRPTPPCTYDFPSFNANHPPPTGFTDTFSLSQNYPDTFPTEVNAWTSINFRTNPEQYADSILAYCLEGNVAADFEGQNNTVRKWYHTPWLHYGEFGREYHHGLTRERNSRPGELHPNQTGTEFTWAVGMYNAKGGYTIGKVWDDCEEGLPNPKASSFPENTVTFKILFTSATNSEVPYMQNSFAWTVNTGPINSSNLSPGDAGWVPRTNRTMRLLQVDIAVKDVRSPIGWVFGTYVYDGFKTGSTPWERLKFVGLSWGNDPGVQARKNDTGAFLNTALNETYIDSTIIGDPTTPVNEAKMYHLGLGGRLNGPVDNPISSCTSCHGKASVLKNLFPDPIDRIGMMPRPAEFGKTPPQITNLDFNDYFGTNIPSGTDDIEYNCFISGFTPCNPSIIDTFVNTDYSLQTAIGIRNFYRHINDLAEEQLTEGSPSPRG